MDVQVDRGEAQYRASDSPMTDQQIVETLRQQRDSQPSGELPPVGEDGVRNKGEIYLTNDNRAVRYIRHEDVDGEQVPIAEDLTDGRRYNDGSIDSVVSAQLDDSYHVGDYPSRNASKRLGQDEALMEASIMKMRDDSAATLKRLDEVIALRKKTEQEIAELQTELDSVIEASGDGSTDTADEQERKQKLVSEISSLKFQLRHFGRESQSYGHEYRSLDSDADYITHRYIREVYQLNPEYFKDMPASEFVEIGDHLAELEARQSYVDQSPTESGYYSVDFAEAEVRNRRSKKEPLPFDVYREVSQYSALDYLEYRIKHGEHMTPKDITDLLGRAVDLDQLDEDIFSSEERAEFNAISEGYNDRPPSETYQMYVEMFKKIGEAVERQRERNAKSCEEFITDLKSRKAEENNN